MKTLLTKCLDSLSTEIESFPWGSTRAYGDWLVQTYYFVRHSTRLLALAAARFPQTELGDVLHQRFITHMAEEKRHELLALHDLKALSLNLADFSERTPTRTFYESQYYKVEHQGPLALFGYILLLEGLAIIRGPWLYASVTKTMGVKAATFLKVHSEDDPDHMDKAFQALAAIDETNQQVIADNLRQSTETYRAILREISAANTNA